MLRRSFEVVVVGCGHAGLEAAHIASKVGAKTLVITSNIGMVGQLSCNPSVGGIGKGHLVKEIDALGGIMGIISDSSCIHKRTLNSSKGASVKATRVQVDRQLYQKTSMQLLGRQPNVQVVQDTVVNIRETKGALVVDTAKNIRFTTRAIVISAGTFLNGKIFAGGHLTKDGRLCFDSNTRLSTNLVNLGLQRLRLKTGTPARVDSRTVDFHQLKEQSSDNKVLPFSFLSSQTKCPKQVSCWIAYTNAGTHEVIGRAIESSPAYRKSVLGVGPRYCLSVEEKVLRFPHKDRHLVFVEPESLSAAELYLNGLSTCLTADDQEALVTSIVGFERAHLTRFGYAIEYDCFNPKHLKRNLESKVVSRVYLAGQVNGTTGYEEAAAQGLVAGLNAALAAKEQDQWFPERSGSYIGVLIDDLVSRGVSEPYRIFTGRSEDRQALREDNADLRLTPIGKKYGTITSERWDLWCLKRDLLSSYSEKKLAKHWESVKPLGNSLDKDTFRLQVLNQTNCESPNSSWVSEAELLNQPDIKLPTGFDYRLIRGLSSEVTGKLNSHKPRNVGQAKRIEGITPASVGLLLAYFRGHAS